MRRAAIAMLFAVGVVACGSGGNDHHAAVRRPHRPAPSTTTTTRPAYLSTVAAAVVPQVAVYPTAGAPASTTILGNPNEDHALLVFLVLEEQGDWLHVDLPVRPNGSTGWIRRADVTTSSNSYQVKVELGAHHITVTNADQVILDAPVAVGKSDTPTPGGVYYIKELLKAPNPNGAYGPYAYGISGFSDVITQFNGSNGPIGIHGTNDPSSIGHDVSHGCIRMTNDNIMKLVPVLPIGTPVELDP